MEIWNEKGEISGVFWQKIVFESVPAFCVSCGTMGHETKFCLRQGRPEVEVEPVLPEVVEAEEVLEAAVQEILGCGRGDGGGRGWCGRF